MGEIGQSLAVKWFRSFAASHMGETYDRLLAAFNGRLKPRPIILSNWPSKDKFVRRQTTPQEYLASVSLAEPAGDQFIENWIIRATTSVFARVSLQLHSRYSTIGRIQRRPQTDSYFLSELVQHRAVDSVAIDPSKAVSGSPLAVYLYFKARHLGMWDDQGNEPKTPTDCNLYSGIETMLTRHFAADPLYLGSTIDVATADQDISQVINKYDSLLKQCGTDFDRLIEQCGLNVALWYHL